MLKFDGEFIIYWLLHNGFKHVEKRNEIEDNTFTTLISDMGQFYNITVYFKKGNKSVKKVTFIDSLKILPFSVKQIAKSFNLPISKLEIDYNKPREKGHKLTEEEKAYIKNDVLIVAKALDILFNQNLTKMTIGSNALNEYKEILSKRRFEKYFPELDYDIDKDLRQSYKGGFTYLNPKYKDKTIENIVNLDVNSLYPSVLHEKPMPFGEPIFYEGEYKEDKIYPLYIQMISCSKFEVYENKIPTIQIKNSGFYKENEYLEKSNEKSGEEIVLVLTSVDLKLFLDHYKVTNLNYIAGWKFKSMKGLFTDYIDKWMKVKIEATISGNKSLRTLAKLMLNSLYGKFATSLDVISKIPFLGDDDIVHYKFSDKETKKGLYIPIGAFVTAYAREKTIRTSQIIREYSLSKYNYDAYVYSDTDSIKCLLPVEDLVKIVDIDDVKLGAWKNEGIATKGKFVRQKCYLEEIDGKINITCSGMPELCYNQVTWNNFKEGLTVHGKLTFKHIRGGVILEETDFTIKEEKIISNIDKFKK